MKLIVTQGATSQKQRIFVPNSSTGAGLTGLAYNTSSLTGYYFRDGDTSTTAISLATASLGTFTSGGFIVVDATHMPGVYEVGIPNAVFANAVSSAIVVFQGASSMNPVCLEYQLVPWNPQDGLRLGLTALPNATAGATGGVVTDTNSSGQLQGVHGNVTGSVGSVTGAVGSVTGAVGSVTGNVGGSVGSVLGSVASVTGAVTISLTQAVPTTNTSQTVGDALNAARAQGFGAWSISGTSLVLYAADGTTVVRTFALNSSTAPTSRT